MSDERDTVAADGAAQGQAEPEGYLGGAAREIAGQEGAPQQEYDPFGLKGAAAAAAPAEGAVPPQQQSGIPARPQPAPAAAQEAIPVQMPADDPMVDKLRIAYVALHAVALAVIFWWCFRTTYASTDGSYFIQGGMTAVFSYLTSYALVIALLAVPGALMAPALAAKGLMADRLALAAAALDAMFAFVAFGFAVALGAVGGLALGLVYLVFSALGIVIVVKR